jgi:hypothetical protein
MHSKIDTELLGTMKKPFPDVTLFLSSVSYLSQEARRSGLRDVLRICQTAERELSKHIIDELLGMAKEDIKISEDEYGHIMDVLENISCLSSEKLEEFIQFLERYDRTLNS